MADMRTYWRERAVVFRKTNERFGGLSNMAPGFPLEIGDTRIRTAEALYQACRFPHLPDVQRLIVAEVSPMTSKIRSKPFRKNSRDDWDKIRVPVMKWCLKIKLAQNWETFGRLLLETDDLPIVEHSQKDEYWGAKDAENGVLRGENVLGRLLMELREKLKTEPEELVEVNPLPIDDFLLFEYSIPTVVAKSGRQVVNSESMQDSLFRGLDIYLNPRVRKVGGKPRAH